MLMQQGFKHRFWIFPAVVSSPPRVLASGQPRDEVLHERIRIRARDYVEVRRQGEASLPKAARLLRGPPTRSSSSRVCVHGAWRSLPASGERGTEEDQRQKLQVTENSTTDILLVINP